VVGQLAKFKGCRVVGVAGGPEKCRIVTESFGFDACIDYKAGRLYEDLAAATPDGIDGNFENVGGPVLDAVLRRMNGFGRIAVCGLIAGYNGEDIALKSTRSILVNRLKVQRFYHFRTYGRLADCPMLKSARQSSTVDFTIRKPLLKGLSRHQRPLSVYLKGKNLGKQLVKLI